MVARLAPGRTDRGCAGRAGPRGVSAGTNNRFCSVCIEIENLIYFVKHNQSRESGSELGLGHLRRATATLAHRQRAQVGPKNKSRRWRCFTCRWENVSKGILGQPRRLISKDISYHQQGDHAVRACINREREREHARERESERKQLPRRSTWKRSSRPLSGRPRRA